MVIPETGAGYSRVTHPFATDPPSKLGFTVRLACVKHAASVRPEPESNSPSMSTGPPPPKRQGNRHNKETPNGAIHPASNTEPPTHGGGPAFWHQHQDPPPTTPTPEETRTTGDEPSRHRLLGTLLSSQRTDAHPNQAHHPVRRQPFKLTGVSPTRQARRSASGGARGCLDPGARRPRRSSVEVV